MPQPRPFLIEVLPGGANSSGEVELRFPAHRLVLEPLIHVASAIWVHGMPSGDNAPPLPPVRQRVASGVFVLAHEQDVLRGWEWFWNADSWHRGSISIAVDVGAVDWAEVLRWTQYEGIPSKNLLRKSSPSAALTYADRTARGVVAVVTFTASNGLQWAAVWADEVQCEALDALAQATCRRFVRWVEHGKYEREIIYDRPPYTAFAKD